MTVSAARFKLSYPSFKNTAAELIDQKIRAATLRIEPGVWGDRTIDGIMTLAAHLLSNSPDGEQARLRKENRGDIYETEWERMKREVTIGVGRLA